MTKSIFLIVIMLFTAKVAFSAIAPEWDKNDQAYRGIVMFSSDPNYFWTLNYKEGINKIDIATGDYKHWVSYDSINILAKKEYQDTVLIYDKINREIYEFNLKSRKRIHRFDTIPQDTRFHFNYYKSNLIYSFISDTISYSNYAGRYSFKSIPVDKKADNPFDLISDTIIYNGYKETDDHIAIHSYRYYDSVSSDYYGIIDTKIEDYISVIDKSQDEVVYKAKRLHNNANYLAYLEIGVLSGNIFSYNNEIIDFFKDKKVDYYKSDNDVFSIVDNKSKYLVTNANKIYVRDLFAHEIIDNLDFDFYYPHFGSYTSYYNELHNFAVINAYDRMTLFKFDIQPSAVFTADSVVLIKQVVDIASPTFSNINVFWDFGDGRTSKKQIPKIIYQEPGTYEIQKTITIDGLSQSVTHSVIVIDSFDLSINPKIRYAHVGQELTFEDTTPVKMGSREWKIGKEIIGTGELIAYKFDQPGAYKLILTRKIANNFYYKSQEIIVTSKPAVLFSSDTTKTKKGSYWRYYYSDKYITEKIEENTYTGFYTDKNNVYSIRENRKEETSGTMQDNYTYYKGTVTLSDLNNKNYSLTGDYCDGYIECDYADYNGYYDYHSGSNLSFYSLYRNDTLDLSTYITSATRQRSNSLEQRFNIKYPARDTFIQISSKDFLFTDFLAQNIYRFVFDDNGAYPEFKYYINDEYIRSIVLQNELIKSHEIIHYKGYALFSYITKDFKLWIWPIDNNGFFDKPTIVQLDSSIKNFGQPEIFNDKLLIKNAINKGFINYLTPIKIENGRLFLKKLTELPSYYIVRPLFDTYSFSAKNYSFHSADHNIVIDIHKENTIVASMVIADSSISRIKDFVITTEGDAYAIIGRDLYHYPNVYDSLAAYGIVNEPDTRPWAMEYMSVDTEEAIPLSQFRVGYANGRIKFFGLEYDAEIHIFDITGRLIHQGQVTSSQLYRVLPPGLYYLWVAGVNNTYLRLYVR